VSHGKFDCFLEVLECYSSSLSNEELRQEVRDLLFTCFIPTHGAVNESNGQYADMLRETKIFRINNYSFSLAVHVSMM